MVREEQGTSLIVLKTALFTLGVVIGVVTVGGAYLVSRLPEPFMLRLGPARYAGWILIAVGALIYLWCARDFIVRGRGTPAPFDPPRRLVVAGLYRFTRNPMYVGVGTILLGEAILFQSSTLLIYALLVGLAFHCRVVYYEEPILRKEFGDSYDRYCEGVPRWIFDVRRLQ